MKKIDYSIIVPVYNSVKTLEPIYVGVAEIMKELNSSFELVYVDDNSKIESWVKLLELKNLYPENITIIKLSKNFGQNGATLCGIDEAQGSILITIDDDLQVHPSEIKKMIDFHKKENADIVYGKYKDENNSVLKKSGSKFIKSIFLKSENGASIGSSVRLINSNVVKYIRHHSQDHLFINQVISWYTSDIKFIEINHNQRPEGNSGYSLFKLTTIAFRLVFFYTSIALKIMIAICVISSLLTLSLAGYYIYKHFALGEGLGFLVIIVIAISLMLASMSIIGIYLNRIYESRVKKPSYAIKLKSDATD